MYRPRKWDRDRVLAQVTCVAPALIIFLVFIVGPVIQSISYSFMEVDVKAGETVQEFVGLDHYRTLLDDEVFAAAAGNTVIWAIASPLLEIPIGLLLALMLMSKLRATRFLRAAWFAPTLLPQVVVGIIWAWILNSEWGLLNHLLETLHLHSLTRAWLGDPNTALAALIFVTTWVWVGFNMILMMAALSSISPEVIEAARIDGASYWRTVRHVLAPMIWPFILNAMILCFVGKMKVFDLIWVTTRGGPLWATETVATYTVKRAFYWGTLEKGYPSAMATVWFLVVLAVSVVANRAVKSAQERM